MATTLPFPVVYQFECAAGSTSVDKEKGIIFGVSLITAGITAKGHDLEVDHTTLEQMLSCAEKKKKVPVKWNHRTGADAVSGYLKNFRIEGNKLLGDWHLLKSHERYAHALELATEMPECLGLSASFRGEDETVGEKKFARCTDLVSADLVASPAANPNGFFEGVDRSGKDMAENQSQKGAAKPGAEDKQFSLADVMAGITALNQRFEQVETRITGFEEFQTNLITELSEGGLEEEEEEPTEFANGAEALVYLQERLAAIEDEKERAVTERAFATYEEKVEGLMELNEQLSLENAAMAEAIKEFGTKTGARIEFTASPEGDGYTHSMTLPDADRAQPRTEFEARCRQLEAEGKAKDEHEAIRLAIRENGPRYQKHLQEIGIYARNL